jgi:hypothetical protein
VDICRIHRRPVRFVKLRVHRGGAIAAISAGPVAENRADDKSFKRAEVIGGITMPDNMQVVSGIKPGDQVVKNALVLENSVEQ